VNENRVLRKISGLEGQKVREDWIKLHNVELRDLYSSPDIIRVIKSRRMVSVGNVARRGEKKNAYTILVGKTYGRRPKRRWNSSFNLDIKYMG
jgi:hypothetical protein